ncbi:MAG: aspartate dehydrogenase [Lachnospiraceae bacterium]|nr:aspartate dehydrogenase [Lachnospiraceae bacterium]
MLFRKKTKTVKKLDYDRDAKKPVLKCSIYNGEQVAGLKDLKTGHFEEIMLVRNGYDLEQFREMVGEDEIPREY